MNFKPHFFIALLIFLGLLFVIPELNTVEVIFFAFMSTFPDIDLKFDAHRHVLTHSIILPLTWVCWYTTTISMYFRMCLLLAFTIHLFLDLRFHKVGGFYTLNPDWTGLNHYKQTTWFLILNGGLGLTIFLVWIYLTVLL